MRALLALAFVLGLAACSRPEKRGPDYPVDRTPPPSGATDEPNALGAPGSDRSDQAAGVTPSTVPGDAGVVGSDKPDAGAEREQKGPLSPPDIIDKPR